jgi:hypothetical protein
MCDLTPLMMTSIFTGVALRTVSLATANNALNPVPGMERNYGG